jgi:hypothetical protein
MLYVTWLYFFTFFLIFFLSIFPRKREERLNKKSEGVSEILSWVSRSRKLGEKRNAEKEKALQLSKVFEEQVSCVSDSVSVYYISEDE